MGTPCQAVVMRTCPATTVLRVAATLWAGAGVAYLSVEAVAAQHFPGYSYSTDYISDLGRPSQSPMAAWMNAAFIAQGVAFALAGALIVVATRPRPGTAVFVALGAVYGAGCAVVGVVPSGGTGSSSLIHIGAATAAIVAGNLAVITAGAVLWRQRLSRIFGVASVAVGIAGLLSGALLLRSTVPDGAFERTAIYTIIGWQLLAAVTVLFWCGVRPGSARPS